MYALRTGPIAATESDLATILFGLHGSTAVTIVARTEPALIGGKKCPYAGLEKLSRVNGIVNFNYENSVNRVRQKEGRPVDAAGEVEHFEAGPRSWGTRLISDVTGKKIPLVCKEKREPAIPLESVANLRGALYLELKVQRSLETQYRFRGELIPFETVEPHLRKSSNPHKVILRDYRLDHIEEIALLGHTYMLAVEIPTLLYSPTLVPAPFLDLEKAA